MPLTGELARIDDEPRRAYDGDCWHGPPLREALKGLTATKARALRPQLAHSTWALVNHVAAWVEVVAMPLIERRAIAMPEAGDFPPVIDTSEGAWAAALDNLDRRHRRLLTCTAGHATAGGAVTEVHDAVGNTARRVLGKAGFPSVPTTP
jgi:hypothetical protein